jgi:hypothetical protein
VYFVGLAEYARVRPIDVDEGFYTTAARLVWEGKTPYKDFFFQQAPLTPYLYSWIWAIHPRSLVAMRFLSAACGGLAVFLWGIALLYAKPLPRNVAFATFAAAVLNPYWVSWNVVVKTYPFANLLMTTATICLYAAVHSKKVRWYFVAGLALGACASVRSLYGPLIPAVLGWLVYHELRSAKATYWKSATFGAGAACGLLPMIVSFLRFPSAFLFNNVRYHGLDAGYMLIGGRVVEGYQSVGHTAIVYFACVVVRLIGMHPYFTGELVLALIGGLSLLSVDTRMTIPQYTTQNYEYLRLVGLMLAVYVVTALMPFPPYDQYFDSPLVPFLLPFVALGLNVILRPGKKWVFLIPVIAAILFCIEIGRETPENWWDGARQLPNYQAVTEAIEANSKSREVVLSFWPGFVFESGRQYFPGLEDQFTYRIMSRIGPQERERYHVANKDQILKAISDRSVNLLVIPPEPWMIEYYENLSSSERQQLQHAVETNYTLVRKIEWIEVYRANGAAKVDAKETQATVAMSPLRMARP